MKNIYVKPELEVIKFQIAESVMSGVLDDSITIGEDDEEGA